MTRSATFARTVERRLERLLQRPVVLSPRDWRVLAGWHARGIPAALVLEAMDEVAAKKRPAPPRGLSYFVRAVEESWRAVQEGRALRAGEAGRGTPGTPSDPAAPWVAALASGRLPDRLARTVTDLVARLRDGDDPRNIDEHLDRELGSGEVAPEAFARARAEALGALSDYQRRMTREAWTRTLAHAVSDRMRAALGLPRVGPVRRVV